LVKIPKQEFDQENHSASVETVESSHDITRIFKVEEKDGQSEEDVARLRESTNHRGLGDALPEPHQPHPSFKIPPTLYQDTFRTHPKNIDNPDTKACPCKRSHSRLGGEQAQKTEHADEAMSRSSPGETKHPRLQRTIDLSDALADAWDEGQKVENLAEDIVRYINL
jgi:hypothetical protein